MTVSPANAAPTFTADTPPTHRHGRHPLRLHLPATGVPDTITYSLVEGAPAFLSIDSETGAVSGTPPTGTTTFTYSVTASNGITPDATAGPFTVTVSPANAAPTFTADTPPTTATVGTPYAYTFAATGVPDTITYSLVEGAPAFLSIDSETGAVSGPRRPGPPASPTRSPPPTASPPTPPPAPFR